MFTSIIPQKNITLWCYEDIKLLMPTVINAMTGLNNAEELMQNYPIKRTRESLSKKSIETLASLSSELSQKESKKTIELLYNKYPLGDKYPKFIAFDTEKEKEFQEQYKKELMVIKKEYPKIKFLKVINEK